MSGFSSMGAKVVASLFSIGYFPFAPGTAASLVTFLIVWIFQPSPAAQIIALGIVLISGTWSAGVIERMTEVKDNRIIVIDEAAGCLVSVLFLPLSPFYLVCAFFLFRLFDILKPPPIGWIDKSVSGGVGVMLDDVAAGIVTNLILHTVHIVRL